MRQTEFMSYSHVSPTPTENTIPGITGILPSSSSYPRRKRKGDAFTQKMKPPYSQERVHGLTLRANAPKMAALPWPSRIRHRVSRCPHLAAGGM